MTKTTRPTHATISISNDLNRLAQDLQRRSAAEYATRKYSPEGYLYRALAAVVSLLANTVDTSSDINVQDTAVDILHDLRKILATDIYPARPTPALSTERPATYDPTILYIYPGHPDAAITWANAHPDVHRVLSFDRPPTPTLKYWRGPVSLVTPPDSPIILTPKEASLMRRWRTAIYAHNQRHGHKIAGDQ